MTLVRRESRGQVLRMFTGLGLTQPRHHLQPSSYRLLTRSWELPILLAGSVRFQTGYCGPCLTLLLERRVRPQRRAARHSLRLQLETCRPMDLFHGRALLVSQKCRSAWQLSYTLPRHFDGMVRCHLSHRIWLNGKVRTLAYAVAKFRLHLLLRVIRAPDLTRSKRPKWALHPQRI